MAPLRFLVIAALAAVANRASASATDGCSFLPDCAGSVDVDLTLSCSSSSYGAAGVIDAKLNGAPARACLQCPGKGEINLDKFPYFTCDGKPICGKVTAPVNLELSPWQAKCLYTNRENLLECLDNANCVPLAPQPAPAPVPAPSSGPVADAPAPKPSPAPGSPSSSPAPSSGPVADGPKPTSAPGAPSSSPAPGTQPSSSPSAGSPEEAGCPSGQLPVSVEGGKTGCAPIPICVGGFPKGNCPTGSFCGTVKTGVPGCKPGNGESTAAPVAPKAVAQQQPASTPAAPQGEKKTVPTAAPEALVKVQAAATITTSTEAPAEKPREAYKCDSNKPVPKDVCVGAINVQTSKPADGACSSLFETTVLGTKYFGCVVCPAGETYKFDSQDPNGCFAYCGATPQCTKVNGPVALDVTPNQSKCIVEGGAVFNCLKL